ncbi:hypothetical protein [Rahnella aceris]
MFKYIKFNLDAEIERICLSELTSAGLKIPRKNKLPLLHLLLNMKKKLIEPRPRLVHFPREFSIPLPNNKGLQILVNKMLMGVNINSYQSNRLHEIDFHDNFLNDFGFHYFHLGDKFDTGKNKKFMVRTGPVLIAKVDDDNIYVVGIFMHQKGEKGYIFADEKLLQILYDNWPKLLDDYIVSNVTGHTLSPVDRFNLRSNGYNALIQLKDNIVIRSPGGGMMGNRLSFDVFNEIIHLNRNLDQLKASLFENVIDRLPYNISFKIITFGHNELSLFSEGSCYFLKITQCNGEMKVICLYPGYGPLYSHGFVNKKTSVLSDFILSEIGSFSKINFLCPFPTIINRKKSIDLQFRPQTLSLPSHHEGHQ